MKVTKKKLYDIKRCYSVNSLMYENANHLLFASEDPDVGCFAFNIANLQYETEVWKKPGGCMSMLQVPDSDHLFLAIQEFYLKVHPSASKLVLVNGNDSFKSENLIDLPYLHRFDVIEYQGACYVILCVIAEDKLNKEDWSKPGQIYAAKLVNNEIQDVVKIADNLFHNHGFFHYEDSKGNQTCYFGSDEGLFKLEINNSNHHNWQINKLMDGPIGEVAVCDIDNDGALEYMVIKKFHGDSIAIYKEVNGKFEEVYQYQNTINFAHALDAGTINGKPTFAAGVRRDDAELFIVQYIDGQYKTTVLDKNVGPANVKIINNMIASANHTANEASVYIFEEE